MDGFRSMLLKEAARTSVGGTFEGFINREITIPQGTRGKASRSQNALRGHLNDEHTNDPTFPRILSDADADFLGGSFARHTKTWPLDDIDIYLPIDGAGLVYTSYGNKLPYTVLTDDAEQSNPLLSDRARWMDGNNISSQKLIAGFAEVLRDHYPTTTRVRRAGEAVAVTLSNDMGFDVVPCFALTHVYGTEYPFYLIPDGNDRWIRTNPKLDTEVSSNLHAANNKTHRRAVKLVKWWNENRFGGFFDSYYIELAIMRDTANRNRSGLFDTSVSAATAAAFAALSAAAAAGNLASWITQAPSVEAPSLTVAQRLILSLAQSNAANALAWEQNGSPTKAIESWASVFGDTFTN